MSLSTHRDEPTDATQTVGNYPDISTKLGAPLDRLNTSELRLMQEITLHQMQSSRGEDTLLLLGRVWYRLEQERRRRLAEVRELEKMYFTPTH